MSYAFSNGPYSFEEYLKRFRDPDTFHAREVWLTLSDREHCRVSIKDGRTTVTNYNTGKTYEI